MGFEKNIYENRSLRNLGGAFYERSLLGAVDIEQPRYMQEFGRLKAEAIKGGWEMAEEGFLPFPHAIKLAKEFQNGNNPANPQTDFAREFRLAIAERLGLVEEVEMNRLKFFTCAGGEKSPADFFHGIDFFISFIDEQGRELIVTGDVTRERKKFQKADILIGGNILAPGQDGFNEKRYLVAIDRYAQEAAMVLKKKIKEQKFWETDMRREPWEKNLTYIQGEPPQAFSKFDYYNYKSSIPKHERIFRLRRHHAGG